MNKPFKLPISGKESAKILQITDPHLFESKDKTLLNVNTYDSYHAVLEEIKQQRHDYDLIIATGDLGQDKTAKAYKHFCHGMMQLGKPCAWIPGNHDSQEMMTSVLEKAGLISNRQILLGKHWQVILLDSQVKDVSYGELSKEQLIWLETCLKQQTQRYAVIVLHHHPIPSGCDWLDQHKLKNANELAQILSLYSQVRLIVCGHIHQDMHVIWKGWLVLATPATCMQFKPNSQHFMLDEVAPGWRELQLLSDGTVKTTVYRLEHYATHPDMNAEGYS